MARYQTSLTVRKPLDETFAYLSDFSRAHTWDPQTKSARKDTPGPIGVGTRFVLVGGALGLNFELPYDIVEYDPLRRVILEGETSIFHYRDIIDFREQGPNTRVHYDADLCFKGLFRIGNPAMRLLFQRIGYNATRDMAAAVENRTER